MTEHTCSEKRTIQEISRQLDEQGSKLHYHEKQQHDLQLQQVEFIKEARETMRSLRDWAVQGKEQQKHQDQKLEVLFQKDRERKREIDGLSLEVNNCRNQQVVTASEITEKKIKPLEDAVKNLAEFKTSHDARGHLIKDLRVTIPVFCAVVTTGIALWKLLT